MVLEQFNTRSAGCLNTVRVEGVCVVVGAVNTCSSGCLNTVTNRHQCGLSETLREMAFTNVRVEGVLGGYSSLTQGQLNASPP